MKFRENISNGFRVTEQTRFCDRQTSDANGKNNMSPNRGGGGGGGGGVIITCKYKVR